MCSPSADTNVLNAKWSTSCQRLITSKREKRLTSSCLAVLAISSTMRAASGFAITFGANCGSISTISASVERILVRPSRIATLWLLSLSSRITELVPNCQRTRSGLVAITSVSKRLSMSRISSPPTPRLITVIEWLGKCCLSSTASRFG